MEASICHLRRLPATDDLTRDLLYKDDLMKDHNGSPYIADHLRKSQSIEDFTKNLPSIK